MAQGQGIVIASHAYNSDTDLNGVKQALEQSTTSMSPGKHYSFTVANSNAWHLIAGNFLFLFFAGLFDVSTADRRHGFDLFAHLRHQLPPALRALLLGGVAENGTTTNFSICGFCICILLCLPFQFVAKAGEKATSAKERQLDKQCGDLLQKICRKYDDLAAVDKLSSVSQKVDSVKLVMQDNIDIALQNCVKLESIGKAAGTLRA